MDTPQNQPTPTISEEALSTPADLQQDATDKVVYVDESDCTESPADTHPETTEEEHERQLREAYLRGRNEAIAKATGADTGAISLQPANRTPGIADTATPPSDPDLANLFRLRPSVWD